MRGARVLLLAACVAFATTGRVWAQGVPTAGEAALWEQVRNSSDRDDLQAYLDAYPHGAYADRARERLAALAGGTAPAAVGPTAARVGSAPETACDRLAEPPHGALGTAAPAFTPAGVADGAVAVAAARDACAQARARYPQEARFTAYLARVEDEAGNEAESRRLYRLAADAGNAFAAYIVGGDALLGRAGMTANEALGGRYLRQAAAGGVLYALEPLAEWSEEGRNGVAQDPAEAARLYRLAADQGDAQAEYRLGAMYEAGAGGLGRDPGQALRLYRLSAAQGLEDAAAAVQRLAGIAAAPGAGAAVPAKMGSATAPATATAPAPATECDRLAEPPRWALATGAPSYTRGGVEGGRMDVAAAQAACTGAMAQFPAEARFVAYAGRVLEASGRGESAMPLYRLAAERGNAFAELALAHAYEHGVNGVAQNDAETVRYARLAAAQGATRALVRLAQWTFSGLFGIPADKEEGFRLTSQAAALGDAEGQTGRGVMMAFGNGTAQDLPGAVTALRFAAEQGDAEGQYWLGVLTERGSGTARDDAAAARLYRSAADAGFGPAEFRLAHLYLEGRGGLKRDERAGVRLLQAAAALGVKEAQDELQARGAARRR